MLGLHHPSQLNIARVIQAIRRTVKQIQECNPALAKHLSEPILTLGHTICYVPRDGLV
jgi:hypothetical protein